MSLKSFLGVSTLLGATLARDVPSNVRNFYNNIQSNGQCDSPLATGFYSEYNDDNCNESHPS